VSIFTHSFKNKLSKLVFDNIFSRLILDIYRKVKESEIEDCGNSYNFNMECKDLSKVGLEM
jgi:hypothetical protein